MMALALGLVIGGLISTIGGVVLLVYLALK